MEGPNRLDIILALPETKNIILSNININWIDELLLELIKMADDNFVLHYKKIFKLQKLLDLKDLEEFDLYKNILIKILNISKNTGNNKELILDYFKLLRLYTFLILKYPDFRNTYLEKYKVFMLHHKLSIGQKRKLYLYYMKTYYACLNSKYLNEENKKELQKEWLDIIAWCYKVLLNVCVVNRKRDNKYDTKYLIPKNKLEEYIINNNLSLFELNFDIKNILSEILLNDDIDKFKKVLLECLITSKYLNNNYNLGSDKCVKNTIKWFINQNSITEYASIILHMKNYRPYFGEKHFNIFTHYVNKKLNNKQKQFHEGIICNKKLMEISKKTKGKIILSESNTTNMNEEFVYLSHPQRFLQLCILSNAYEIFNSYVDNINQLLYPFFKYGNMSYIRFRLKSWNTHSKLYSEECDKRLNFLSKCMKLNYEDLLDGKDLLKSDLLLPQCLLIE